MILRLSPSRSLFRAQAETNKDRGARGSVFLPISDFLLLFCEGASAEERNTTIMLFWDKSLTPDLLYFITLSARPKFNSSKDQPFEPYYNPKCVLHMFFMPVLRGICLNIKTCHATTCHAAIGENRNRCTGHTWRFSPIAAIGV